MIPFVLTKLLPIFVYPLGAALLVGTIALALSFTTWRRSGQVLLGFAVVALWLAATPVVANWLNWRLESQFPPASVEMLPQSDVVVLLGGVGLRAMDVGKTRLVFGGVGSRPLPPRVMHALRIYGAGKAPLIVISAGNLPWQAAAVPEAQLIAERLVDLGAPPSALILETKSRNTRENAVNTAALFKEHGWRTGLLVTSGAHMPRALAAFQKVGLSVIPAATDIRATPLQSLRFVSVFDLLPDAGALYRTTLAIKEMIGLCVYRYRGWA